MSGNKRSIDECPYRSPLAGEGSIARCGLIEQLISSSDEALCRVGRDACAACCHSFAPTPSELNPVVASLLYGVSTEIVHRGGASGCSLEQARELNRIASEYISWEQDCLDIPPGKEIPAASARLEEIIPLPRRRVGKRVKQWAVGVTTAPRGQPTLEECLTSLASAGWNDPRLFVDGDAALPPRCADLDQTCRSHRVGAWPSYYLALAELMMRQPEADAFLLVQDDVVFAEGFFVRGYLEDVLWPGKKPGIVSLLCPHPYTKPDPGWYPFDDDWIWGAQAFAFSREAAQGFLTDSRVLQHRYTRHRNPLADIDWCVGQWAKRQRQPIYYPTPSLVQHVGQISSLWPGQRAWGYRRASWVASRSGFQPDVP
jgi:hypothetical protein